MKTPTQDELKDFCQLVGVHWHEWALMTPDAEYCVHCPRTQGDCKMVGNPTFLHPEDVLKVMMKRKDWEDFLETVGYGYEDLIRGKKKYQEYVEVKYIIKPYALFYAALEWLKKGEGK